MNSPSPNPPELFAQPPVRSEFTRVKDRPLLGRRRIMLLALFIGLAAGFGAYWFFGGSETVPAEPPIVTAEGPFKQKPENPGGIEIPHQDETVFQRIENSSTPAKPAVEHLLPSPEAPQPLIDTASAVAPSAAVSAETPVTQEKIDALTSAPRMGRESLLTTAETQGAALQQAVQAPAAAEVPAQVPAQEEQKAQETPKAKTAESKTKTQAAPAPQQTGKGFLVQLGSFPSQAIAKEQANKLQKKYSDTLNGVQLRTARADLGPKGVYYRIQGGPVPETKARAICATLWSQKSPCILVRP